MSLRKSNDENIKKYSWDCHLLCVSHNSFTWLLVCKKSRQLEIRLQGHGGGSFEGGQDAAGRHREKA